MARLTHRCLNGAFLCAALLLAPTASAEDWPRFRGPHSDGVSREKDWLGDWDKSDGPKQLWKASTGLGYSSITVADNRAITMSNEKDVDTVWSFQADNGKLLWKHSYPSPLDPNLYEGGPSSTPTIDNGRVYTLSKDGQLFCLNAEDGKARWQTHMVNDHGLKKPTWGFASSALILGDRLFLNAGGAGACFDKNNGKLIWLSSKEPAAYSTPVPFKFGQRDALLFLSHRELVAVAQGEGDLLWRHPWETSYDTSSPDVVVSGAKFFASSYRKPSAMFDSKGGAPERVWEQKDFHQHLNAPVLIGGILYGFHGDNRHDHEFKAVNFETGQIAWTEKNLPVGGAIGAGDKLILLTSKGELVIAEASPAKFTAVARAQILGGKCWTAPTLANAKIYARNSRGDIVCFATK